jgi:type II secretory pathway component GspD/PulD (secretin)
LHSAARPYKQTATAAETSQEARPTDPRQVLIEAAIFEVALPGAAASGGAGGAEAVANSGRLEKVPFGCCSATNTGAGQPGATQYLINLGNDFDTMLSTLAKQGRVKILQRPRIQTAHAVTASMFIGESRPVGQGPQASMVPIGTTFQVTPFIKPDGRITLDLDLEITRCSGQEVVPNVGPVPTTTSQAAKAKLEVRDRDTLLMGGWSSTRETSGQRPVAFPKDLPTPGTLAGQGHGGPTHTEIMVLIRPTILGAAANGKG